MRFKADWDGDLRGADRPSRKKVEKPAVEKSACTCTHQQTIHVRKDRIAEVCIFRITPWCLVPLDTARHAVDERAERLP